MFDLVRNAKFKNFIILTILFASVILAVENPLNDPKSNLVKVLFFVDLVTTTIFCIEVLANIIAYGFFFNGDASYLQNVWNFLDFLIVVVSAVSLSNSAANLNFFKILRLLRILRPLRVIARN